VPGTRLEHLLSAFPELASQPEWTDSRSASWYRHGELMLDTLVSALIEPVLEQAIAACDHDCVARLLAFVDLLADSPQDIARVNALRGRLALLIPGINPRIVFPRRRHLWVTDRPNILAPGTLDRIKTALARRDVVFGYHSHFYGGSSPTLVSWIDVAAFMDSVGRARPGDRYELWSLDDLLAKGLAFTRVPERQAHMTDQMGILDSAAAALRTYLTESQDEIVVVWRLIHHGARHALCGARIEGDASAEHFADEALDIAGCGGEVYAFRMRDLEQSEDLDERRDDTFVVEVT
jgi:hypothetical protein